MRRTMVSRRKLNLDNLEALGAKRLAKLLMDVAESDAATNRRLQLELAAHEAPETVAAEVRKGSQIARARSFVDWRKMRDLAADLEAQRRAIVDQVAKIDAADALELMWLFMDMADAVHARCDDSNGIISDDFRGACLDLGSLAEAVKPDPVALADRAFSALSENGYGQYDHLIETLSPSLGAKGLDHLKARFIELSKTPAEKPASRTATTRSTRTKSRRAAARAPFVSPCGRLRTPSATWMPSSLSTMRRRERSRRSLRILPGACSRPAARKRRCG